MKSLFFAVFAFMSASHAGHHKEDFPDADKPIPVEIGEPDRNYVRKFKS